MAVSRAITGSTSSRTEVARTSVAMLVSPTGTGVSSPSGAGDPTVEAGVCSESLIFWNRFGASLFGARKGKSSYSSFSVEETPKDDDHEGLWTDWRCH